jgi:hypothetical protein
MTSNERPSCQPEKDHSIHTKRLGRVSSSTIEKPLVGLSKKIIDGFERLDKWKGCQTVEEGSSTPSPKRLVFEHNRARAAATGFPTRLEVGQKQFGLTDHEVAAIFGWTTGDYRFVNPIARGQDRVVFEEYPFLPNSMTQVTCELSRQDVMPYIHVLDSALSKLPTISSSSSSQQSLWRGHRRKVSSEIGTTLVLNGFTSASRDRDSALAFAEKANEGKSDKRTLLAFVEHSSSRCLAKVSARRNEVEVIFPRDSTFEVVASPTDRSEDDKLVVQRATERLRKSMPDAEIEVVYLKEVATADWM